MKFIYIASPYTKGDVAVNVRVNIEAGDRVAKAGYYPFIPLLTHFWHLIFPNDYKFWTAQDMGWLERCDAIIRLPGESSGADAEVEFAKRIGIPVFYSVEEFLESRS